MNKEQKAKIKDLLLKKREEVTEQMSRMMKDGSVGKSQKDVSGDLSGYSLHMADQATDNFDREMQYGYATTEQKMLYEIDAALARLKEKSFGECVSCGSEIPLKRLMAVPHAKLCIKCQEQEDKNPRTNE
ncbi:MAG: TraR/DksA C4-type zinc finger protein [Candidatus Omnitrophica bacterium]|nr:TraR/DksA C4-type zinc finger protein [Candidatus Omnitrophota bacterium]